MEMLAQHMITRPVFDALFKDYQFVKNNAVSRSMQRMLELLESEAMEKDTEVLNKFYENVRMNVGDIDNLEGKQMLIKNLYEKFFKGAFPKTVDSWVSFIHPWNAWILLFIPLTISCARNLIAAFRMRMYIS